jgi:hypothetical protein
MGSSSQMYKLKTSWHKVQKQAEDLPPPPVQGSPDLCKSCTRPCLGLCYSSEGSKMGKGIRSDPGESPPRDPEDVLGTDDPLSGLVCHPLTASRPISGV